LTEAKNYLRWQKKIGEETTGSSEAGFSLLDAIFYSISRHETQSPKDVAAAQIWRILHGLRQDATNSRVPVSKDLGARLKAVLLPALEAPLCSILLPSLDVALGGSGREFIPAAGQRAAATYGD
jgi:ribosomal protein S15P/S13E